MKIICRVSMAIFCVCVFSCSKKSDTTNSGSLADIAAIDASGFSNITDSTAQFTAVINGDGGSPISAKGVCWSTNPNPTIADSKTSNRHSAPNHTNSGKGMAGFTATITGLTANTNYYLRVYATNSTGTAYSNQTSFATTSPGASIATLAATNAVDSIASTTARSGGRVLADGGAIITARGVCWSTSSNPTIADSKTANGADTGSFKSNLTGLIPSTLYYVRAYATNSEGTAYGSQVSFTSAAPVRPALSGTTAVTSITTTTANSGGNITSDGGASVTARGVCWSTNQNPTVSNTKTSDGTGTGAFTSSLTGLTPNTLYYVRSYATNAAGTAYGSQVSFTSTSTASVPTFNSTSTVNSITSTTATSGGNITSDGGATVTARGVCWSITSSPTTANSKTTNGTGIGIFTSNMTGLSANTFYYVRAYATNSVGTSYGNQVTFTTSPGLSVPVLAATTAINSITPIAAASGGNITSDGGDPVTARGVCWSTSPNPTIANSKTSNGSGAGVFTSNLSGLTANTLYYVRAFATNSFGTGYGTEISFTSHPGSTGTIFNSALTYGQVSDIDGNVYKTIVIGTQTWMAENLRTTRYKDGTAITTGLSNADWSTNTTGAYAIYNDDPANNSVYGKMYNWYAVNTGKLAPAGWHVPTAAEWQTLIDYLGGLNLAGGHMKSVTSLWVSPNDGADNSSGFSGLPGGVKAYTTGTYSGILGYGFWWSATSPAFQNGTYRKLRYDFSYSETAGSGAGNGMSIRCVKD